MKALEQKKIYIYLYSCANILGPFEGPCENIPQKGPEYSHGNLAIARFLVTALRKNIGGLLS